MSSLPAFTSRKTALRKTRNSFALRLFVPVAILAFFAAGATLNNANGAEAAALPLQSSLKVQPEESARFILRARDEAMIGAEVFSRITAIPLKLGEAFKQGDVLLVLDDTISKAGYRRALALEKSAAQKFATVSDMFSRKDASIVEMEEARSELEAARATTTVAKKQLDDCKIIAPYDGRIQQVLVNEHELVEKGQPLLKITGDGVLLAGFLLPEKFFPIVKRNQQVKLFLPLLNQTLSGTVARIAPMIEPSSNTFELYVQIPNKDGKLCAGMNGWIEYTQFLSGKTEPKE